MKITVENIGTYIENIVAQYDHFPEGGYYYIIEEINALQELYFERYSGETVIYSATGNNGRVTFSSMISSGESVPNAATVLAVFASGKELPLLSPVNYARSKDPAATVLSDAILFRTGTENNSCPLQVICHVKPAKVFYSTQYGFSGVVQIPEKHLPLLSSKIREIVSRLTGEGEEADRWAEVFNRHLSLLEQQNAGKS